jgi:hypothetical protein
MPIPSSRKTPLTRRFLAAGLALLFALQPIGAASPRCAIAGLATGRGACCCATNSDTAENTTERAPSCCSTAQAPAPSEGVSVAATAERCGCGVDAPQAPSALPQDASAQAGQGGSHALKSWIDRGAEASATVVLPETRPPCSDLDPPPPPRLDLPGTFATSVARGPRGLLAVTCVARC